MAVIHGFVLVIHALVCPSRSVIPSTKLIKGHFQLDTMKPTSTILGLVLASGSRAANNVTNNSYAIYKDASYSASDRAADLLSRMTWTEKIGQMGGVRRLLGSGLSFNQTSYDILAETQNGILGMFTLVYALMSCLCRCIKEKS